MNLVETVLINWKRPKNVAQIVSALQSQTEPCTITVCDCHPSAEFALDDKTISSIDRLYRWSHNCGAFSRYVPTGGYDHQFTFFLDDDMLPGLKCVEHFLRSARQIGDFGVLGQDGRIIPEDGIYRYGHVPRRETFVETDVIVRGYFVSTRNLSYIQKFRWTIGYFDEPLPEDDLILCTALQVSAGLYCYLTPLDPDQETLMNKRELNNDYALSMRSDHLTKRREFLQRARQFGWCHLKMREKKEK
jgi:hypothetical protein